MIQRTRKTSRHCFPIQDHFQHELARVACPPQLTTSPTHINLQLIPHGALQGSYTHTPTQLSRPLINRSVRRPSKSDQACHALRAPDFHRAGALCYFPGSPILYHSRSQKQAPTPTPLLVLLWLRVRVLGFVVHDHCVAYIIKRVRLCLPWVVNQRLLQLRIQLRQVIDGLPCVD